LRHCKWKAEDHQRYESDPNSWAQSVKSLTHNNSSKHFYFLQFLYKVLTGGKSDR
jgi:hypothetical protein